MQQVQQWACLSADWPRVAVRGLGGGSSCVTGRQGNQCQTAGCHPGGRPVGRISSTKPRQVIKDPALQRGRPLTRGAVDAWLAAPHTHTHTGVRVSISVRVTQRVTSVLRRARPRPFSSVLSRPVVFMIGPMVIFGSVEGVKAQSPAWASSSLHQLEWGLAAQYLKISKESCLNSSWSYSCSKGKKQKIKLDVHVWSLGCTFLSRNVQTWRQVRFLFCFNNLLLDHTVAFWVWSRINDSQELFLSMKSG